MKTPEEIKKDLASRIASSICRNCPHCLTALELIEQHERERDAVIEAFRSVVWYDGHKGWLMGLVEDIEKAEGNVNNPFGVDEWHSEKHAIWMLLCGMFGDWGSSIRGGWIDKKTEAAAFIRSICDTQEVE